jgi:hypothetical protein
MKRFTLALSFLLSACGNDSPASAIFTIEQQQGTGNSHVPLIAGSALHFTNLVFSLSSQTLNFIFSIDAGGITSIDATNYLNSVLVLRMIQGNQSKDFNFTISSNGSGALGANFTLPQSVSSMPNFDSALPASFQLSN